MKIAVEGCAHGELDKIYETIKGIEDRYKFTVDLLIICGDFQAVRNASDMDCMAVPKKYQEMKDFHKLEYWMDLGRSESLDTGLKALTRPESSDLSRPVGVVQARYYSGEKKAALLTLVIGGNHEASNYLAELAYGGWLCENIYYMGYASVVNVNGVRIAGISGIYKGHDYLKGHFEVPPYNESTKRSAYHLRNLDIFRLKQLKEPLDVVVSHDWPRGVYNHGDREGLLRKKRFFRAEVEANQLGCRPTEELLAQLKPRFWFAAHLHCKFAALVPHQDGTCTKFLALDKCLPKRDFLQTVDIASSRSGPPQLSYDPEWLCILRSTDHLLRVDPKNHYMPGPGGTERWEFTPNEKEKAEVVDLLGDLKVPSNFERIAPIFTPGQPASCPRPYPNPQTRTFCETLGLKDPLMEALRPSPLNLSGFLGHPEPGEEDVTSKTFPSLDVDTTQEEEDNDVEEGGSPEMESEDPLEPHEMSSEERRKVHLLEYGGPSPAPTTPVAEFPVVRTTPSSDDRPKESPPTRGTTMKRRNQSIYTEPDDED